MVLLIAAEYQLTDLLSSAGATIGVIIAGTIFLQFLSTKYTELAGRLREITNTYRAVDCEQGRHAPLQSLIRGYRRRLDLLSWASTTAAVALLCFLTAVMAGGLSMVRTGSRIVDRVGEVGLLLGLLMMAAGVLLELIENVLSRQEIGDEIADLDDDVKRRAC